MNPNKTLVLLHGALGSKEQFKPLIKKLNPFFVINSFNFSGHGGSSFTKKFSIELFTKELHNFLEENHLDNVFIFGYSMGGYVALNAALSSNRIKKIITLGTKFNWTKESAQHEVKRLDAKKIVEKVPDFANTLHQRHLPENWENVISNTAELMLELGNKPLLTDEVFEKIKIPVIISRGREDNMVSEDESKNAVNQLPNATYKEFENFKHPLEQIDQDILVQFIKEELSNERSI